MQFDPSFPLPHGCITRSFVRTTEQADALAYGVVAGASGG